MKHGKRQFYYTKISTQYIYLQQKTTIKKCFRQTANKLKDSHWIQGMHPPAMMSFPKRDIGSMVTYHGGEIEEYNGGIFPSVALLSSTFDVRGTIQFHNTMHNRCSPIYNTLKMLDCSMLWWYWSKCHFLFALNKDCCIRLIFELKSAKSDRNSPLSQVSVENWSSKLESCPTELISSSFFVESETDELDKTSLFWSDVTELDLCVFNLSVQSIWGWTLA